MEMLLGLLILIGITVASILLGLFGMWFDWACPDEQFAENCINHHCCCLSPEMRTKIINFLDTHDDDPIWPPMRPPAPVVATRPTTTAIELTRVSATSATVVDNTEASSVRTQPNVATSEITQVSPISTANVTTGATTTDEICPASTIPIPCAATSNEVSRVSATSTPPSATVVDNTEAAAQITTQPNVATSSEITQFSPGSTTTDEMNPA